jgi:hypothetical protein
MTSDGITCVEWSDPVDAVDLLRQSNPHAQASGTEVVYLIEQGGAALYCGCTRRSVPDRLRAHWGQRTNIGKLLRRFIWCPVPITVRWAVGNTALEAHVIHALFPRCNKLTAKHMRVAATKAQQLRVRTVSRGNKPKLTQEQREELRRRALSGEKRISLAAEFGVSPTTVTHVCNGKKRRDVSAPEPKDAAA